MTNAIEGRHGAIRTGGSPRKEPSSPALRQLSRDECRLLGQLGLADRCDHEPDTRLAVDASFVAAVLSGRHGRGGPALPNLVFAALDIIGTLELGAAEAGAALSFIDCRFAQDITARDAKLGSLSLLRCELLCCMLDAAQLDSLLIDQSRLRALRMRAIRARRVAILSSEVAERVEAENCDIDDHISIARSRLPEGIELRRARVEALILRREAVVGAVSLDRAHLGSLRFATGTQLTGALAGRRFHVDGTVVLEGAIISASGPAMALVNARIDDTLRLGDGFLAEGTISIDHCRFGGDLVFQGCVSTADSLALDISGVQCERLAVHFAQCDGAVSIRRSECQSASLQGDYRCLSDHPLHLGITCHGRLSIGRPEPAMHLAGTLSLIDTSCRELIVRNLQITASADGPWRGVALAARHLRVATIARFGHADDAHGIRLTGAIACDYGQFGDDLRLIGIDVETDRSSPALSLREATIAGDLVIGTAAARVSASGCVDLSGAKIDGDLMFDAMTLRGEEHALRAKVDLSSANIGGRLFVGAIAARGPWSVDLEEAKVGSLDDSHGAAWSAGGDMPRIALTTFRYQRLADLGDGATLAHDAAVAARIGWIDRYAGARTAHLFRATPYHMLATVLNDHGDASGARSVEVAARRAKRRAKVQQPWVRMFDWAFDISSGYGYAPGRAIFALLAYFAIGYLGVAIADRQGAFEPAPSLESTAAARALRIDPRGCAWLEPPLYALDVMLPVLSLGQEQVCALRAERRSWNWLQAIYRVLGSILVSVALLTFSGLLKRDRD